MTNILAIKRLTLIGSMCLALTAFSTTTFASGSFSGGSSAGLQNAYNMGKALLYKKMVCEDCPAPDSNVGADDAERLIQNLESGEGAAQSLNQKERKAVIHYLQKRFDIS